MRLIDADVLINRIVFHTDFETDVKELFEDEINAEPTIESERKRGRWIDDNGNPVKIADGATNRSCWCSVCGEWLTASDEYNTKGNFCPNCGAKMAERDVDDRY